ncbi:unnamed protein product [Sphagnum balticum]
MRWLSAAAAAAGSPCTPGSVYVRSILSGFIQMMLVLSMDLGVARNTVKKHGLRGGRSSSEAQKQTCSMQEIMEATIIHGAIASIGLEVCFVSDIIRGASGISGVLNLFMEMALRCFFEWGGGGRGAGGSV